MSAAAFETTFNIRLCTAYIQKPRRARAMKIRARRRRRRCSRPSNSAVAAARHRTACIHICVCVYACISEFDFVARASSAAAHIRKWLFSAFFQKIRRRARRDASWKIAFRIVIDIEFLFEQNGPREYIVAVASLRA